MARALALLEGFDDGVSRTPVKLAPAGKAPPGTFGLPVIFMGLADAKPSKFSTYIDVVVAPDAASRLHAPTVETVDREMMPVAMADAAKGVIHVLVSRTKIDDPRGGKNFNGTPKKLTEWHKLEKPYVIHPQQRLRVWVDGKLEDALKEKPKSVILGGCYLEPYTAKDKEKGSDEEQQRISLKASSLIGTNDHPHIGDLPLIPRLRHLFPLELQSIPTRAEFALADHMGEAGGGGVVRLEIVRFPTHPRGTSAVVPVESTSAVVNRRLAVAANELPLLVVAGNKITTKGADGKDEVTGQHRPKIGGNVLLRVSRIDDLAKADQCASVKEMQEQGLVKTMGLSIGLYPDAVLNMPGWFLPLTKALVDGTDLCPPMPFTILATINREATLKDLRADPNFPDGILTASVRGLGLIYDVRRSVEQYGIRVSHKFVHDGRFRRGANLDQMVAPGDSAALWISDAMEGKQDAQNHALVKYDRIDPVENPDGVVLLDVLMQGIQQLGEMQDGRDVMYYVRPLYTAMPKIEEAAAAQTPEAVKAEETQRATIKAALDEATQKARDNPAVGDAYVKSELVRLGRLKEGDDMYEAIANKASVFIQTGAPLEYEKVHQKYKAFLPYFATIAVLAPRTPPDLDPYGPVPQPSEQRTDKEDKKKRGRDGDGHGDMAPPPPVKKARGPDEPPLEAST